MKTKTQLVLRYNHATNYASFHFAHIDEPTFAHSVHRRVPVLANAVWQTGPYGLNG